MPKNQDVMITGQSRGIAGGQPADSRKMMSYVNNLGGFNRPDYNYNEQGLSMVFGALGGAGGAGGAGGVTAAASDPKAKTDKRKVNHKRTLSKLLKRGKC